ncbi:MAG: dimethylarginine dimethylaminohydrolase family protein [Nanoarchaeota archaeon]
MKEIVMCNPKFYDVIYEINPWMKISNKVNKELAKKQWNNLKNNFTKNNVKVNVLIPNKNCPDMVFTANHGIVLNDSFIASNFLKQERKFEIIKAVDQIMKLLPGFKYNQCPYPFEGEAELFHLKDNIYIGGYNKRTVLESHFWFEKNYKLKIYPLFIKNSKFYHLDTCLTIRNNIIYLYEDAFLKKDVDNLKKKFKVICVSKEIAMAFGMNCIQLKNSLITPIKDLRLRDELKKIFQTKIIYNDMSEFIKSGGACFCSKMILKR